MTGEIGRVRPARNLPGREARKRRWARRILLGIAALMALVVLGSWAFIKFQPTSPPLALPTAPASAPAGPLDGTWTVSGGSVAGFRVPETAFGMSNETVGRTTAVSGTLVVSGGQVTSATFCVDLTAIKVNGKTQPQFARSLDTRRFPAATFTLARPAALGSSLASGGTVNVTATGQLSMNGVTRQVTVTVSGRRDGPALQVAGSIPVAFSAWGIKGPAGFGFVGSLADHGVAEFLLTLHQS
jgi:polyisoprenoid-binding protein YceI